MLHKKIILVCLIAFNVSYSFGQVAKSRHSLKTLKSAKNAKDSAAIIKDNNRAHATLNTNNGINEPSTTSGTMNSPVNPNSQVVIPFGQKKKKSVPVITTSPKK